MIILLLHQIQYKVLVCMDRERPPSGNFYDRRGQQGGIVHSSLHKIEKEVSNCPMRYGIMWSATRQSFQSESTHFRCPNLIKISISFKLFKFLSNSTSKSCPKLTVGVHF